MRQIAHQIHNETDEGGDFDFAVYFVPTRTYVCTQVLKDEGVFSSVYLGEFHADPQLVGDHRFCRWNSMMSLHLSSMVTTQRISPCRKIHHQVTTVYGGLLISCQGKDCGNCVEHATTNERGTTFGRYDGFQAQLREIDTCVIFDQSRLCLHHRHPTYEA